MANANSGAQLILDRLMEIEGVIHRTLEGKARQMGLSAAQMAIAQDLANHPDSNLQEVCSRLGWPKSTVSRLVGELTAIEIAIRSVPSEDRRTVVLSLSPSAREACLSNVLADFFPASGGKLSGKKAEEIVATLDRILYMMRK
jgi:DNA-binding MarR family transcriptional regulator